MPSFLHFICSDCKLKNAHLGIISRFLSPLLLLTLVMPLSSHPTSITNSSIISLSLSRSLRPPPTRVMSLYSHPHFSQKPHQTPNETDTHTPAHLGQWSLSWIWHPKRDPPDEEPF
ncbi:hypothetical protein BGZ57DRAFT_903037 [Hyaloscypha finlandica]|nr:hypothetical protein BGZ57DRAFT_903037 [Hyaloscypha finlandica]